MCKTVHKNVIACDVCQRHKHPTQPPAGTHQPLPPAPTPFHRVGVNPPGPFRTSATWHKYICVAIDHSTRYAETKSLPTATAPDIARCLHGGIILKHSAPRELITDRGRFFMLRIVSGHLRSCSTLYALRS